MVSLVSRVHLSFFLYCADQVRWKLSRQFRLEGLSTRKAISSASHLKISTPGNLRGPSMSSQQPTSGAAVTVQLNKQSEKVESRHMIDEGLGLMPLAPWLSDFHGKFRVTVDTALESSQCCWNIAICSPITLDTSSYSRLPQIVTNA